MDDLDREIDELFKNNSKKIPQRTKKFLFAFVFALIFSFVADKFSFLFPANTIFRSIYYFILIVLIVFLIVTNYIFMSRNLPIEKNIKNDENLIRKEIIEPILKNKLIFFNYDINGGLSDAEVTEVASNLSINLKKSFSKSVATISVENKIIEIADLDLYSYQREPIDEGNGYILDFTGYIVKIKIIDKKPEDVMYNKILPEGLKYYILNDELCFIFERRRSLVSVSNPRKFAHETIEFFLEINNFVTLLLENKLTKDVVDKLQNRP